MLIQTLSQWKEEGRPLFLSTVAEAEILCFGRWSTQEQHIAEQFLEENFTSISLDRRIARIAADIRKTTKIKFPDAAIAATALFTHTPLVTRNQKDFKVIVQLPIISI